MDKNVGGVDRIGRIAVGAVLLIATAMGMLPVWGWIGVIPLATGLLNWCPAYSLFGFNSCSSCADQEL